ncbi:MAG: class I SAM-dependent methyltransferase [Bryobacteraceae bacterium]
MRWLFKAAVQGAISQLPDSARWNYYIQKNVTRSFDDKHSLLSRRFQWCAEHLELHARFRPEKPVPQRVLELGAGWIPTVPLALFLSGVEEIYTIDVQRLIRDDLLGEVLDYLAASSLDEIRRMLPTARVDRYRELQSAIAACRQPAGARKAGQNSPPQNRCVETGPLFDRLGIRYVIGDARSTGLEPASIDYIVSNTTLEHIGPDVLDGIFREFRRIVHPHGLMSHLIDMGDHYQHFDPSITPYNFLRYRSSTWRLLNNDVMYQNRLRITHYQSLHRQTGFHIVHEAITDDYRNALKDIELAPEFRQFKPEELAPTAVWAVSKPNGLPKNGH